MPKLKEYDRAAVDALVRRDRGVVRRSDLLALGMPKSTLTDLTGARGRWRRLLPAVLLTHRGTPTEWERRRAALLHAGPDARISGLHALDLHAALPSSIDVGETVLVVIPADVHRTSAGFCEVERTERDPGELVRRGFPVTSVARACADAVRGHEMGLDDVREVMSGVVREDKCTLEQLQREILTGPTQRSAFARTALLELGAGTRSSAEARAMRLIAASDLPQPLWNEQVLVDGRWIGEADAYWPDLGVVLEIDSMTWHLGARRLRRTQEKARRYAAAGILLVSIAPADLLADPTGFLDTVRGALAAAAARRAM